MSLREIRSKRLAIRISLDAKFVVKKGENSISSCRDATRRVGSNCSEEIYVENCLDIPYPIGEREDLLLVITKVILLIL